MCAVGPCHRSICCLYFNYIYLFFYLYLTIQEYPAENKVNDLIWDSQSLMKILLRYNPLTTVYEDDTGLVVWDSEQIPVLYDPFEQFGSLLRVCATLGWTYRCKTATNKISLFINKNWLKHLQSIPSITVDMVFCFARNFIVTHFLIRLHIL